VALASLRSIGGGPGATADGGVRRVRAPGRVTQPPLRVGIALAPRSGLMSAGILGVAHRRDALDRGGPWIVDDQVLKGHDAQPIASHVEQLSRSKKELRPCRSPKALVLDRERLVEQRTWGHQPPGPADPAEAGRGSS
jgi:hypothetical protein